MDVRTCITIVIFGVRRVRKYSNYSKYSGLITERNTTHR